MMGGGGTPGSPDSTHLSYSICHVLFISREKHQILTYVPLNASVNRTMLEPNLYSVGFISMCLSGGLDFIVTHISICMSHGKS